MNIKFIDNGRKVEEGDYNENLSIVRHTAAHILAQAVKRLYGKDVLLATGPATDDGFYYDFDNLSIGQEDLEKIESEIKKILKENQKTEIFSYTKQEAIDYMKKQNNVYKLEILNEMPDDSLVYFFKQGDFIDMCKGPHLLYLKSVGHIKLLSVTGAYWKGKEKNKMLTRISGTCFAKSEDLEAYLDQRKQAIARDHNKIGRELELFTTAEEVGQGLPLFMPKGTKMLQILQRFVEDEEEKRGYLLTKTPYMAKKELYQISGHWDHYKDGMFVLGDEEKDDEVYALRPMTCPFQFMIYKAKLHSYKELPIGYTETSILFRNEASGEMHGLTRVRQFTLADGHIIVTEDQIEEEFKKVLEFIDYIMDVLDIKNEISYRFSKWDPNDKVKYIDNPKAWNSTQEKMKKILDDIGLDYIEADGEAAFYGPKLDIQYKNVYGKEDTLITIQIDFALPERFDLTYVDKDGSKKRPFVIHRSSIGCYERTLAMLIEKYAGAFPVWIAPVQAKILNISDNQLEYAKKIKEELMNKGIRVDMDIDTETIGKKIRQAQLEKVPYMVVIGQKEQDSNMISVRARSGEDLGDMTVDYFAAKVQDEVRQQLKK